MTSCKIRPRRHFLSIGLAMLLSGCGMMNRLAEVGREPPLTQIQNPVTSPTYRPVGRILYHYYRDVPNSL